MEVLSFLTTVEIVGFASYPIVSKLFGSLKDRGYSISKQFGLAILSFIVLSLSQLFQSFSLDVRVSMSLLIGVSSFLAYKTRSNVKESTREIVMQELIFVLTYALSLCYIAHKPQIYFAYSEDFMDFAIIKTILRSKTLPPYDPWFAEKSLSYYYFGHLIASILIDVSGVRPEVGYNLAIATFFSMAVQTAFGLGYNLTGKKLHGALTVVLTCFMGFMSGFLQLLAYLIGQQIFNYKPFHGSFLHWLKSFNFYAANWVIPHVIVFYPFFTFLQVDLHAHYMSIPFQLAFILACFALYKRFSSFTTIAILLFSLFSAGINVWDFPAYFLLFIATLYMSTRDKRVIVMATGLIALTFAVLVSKGLIGLVSERTSLLGFLQIFAVFTFASLVYSAKLRPKFFPVLLGVTLVVGFLIGMQLLFLAAILILLLFHLSEGERPEVYSKVLAAIAIALVLFCELFYVNDAMGKPYERMNTVMKIYLDVWVLWGVSVACFARKFGRKAITLLLVLVALSMIHPIATMVSMPNNTLMGKTSGLTLDGMKWLEESMPSEYRAIKWLDNRSGVVLEAPGIAYTYSSRVSTFTGLPTVIGWETHEVMWGRGWKAVEERVKDVNSIYTNGSRSLVEKYKVKYIFVGKVERGRYQSIGLRNCSWLRVVYRYGGVVVYEVNS